MKNTKNKLINLVNSSFYILALLTFNDQHPIPHFFIICILSLINKFGEKFHSQQKIQLILVNICGKKERFLCIENKVIYTFFG